MRPPFGSETRGPVRTKLREHPVYPRRSLVRDLFRPRNCKRTYGPGVVAFTSQDGRSVAPQARESWDCHRRCPPIGPRTGMPGWGTTSATPNLRPFSATHSARTLTRRRRFGNFSTSAVACRRQADGCTDDLFAEPACRRVSGSCYRNNTGSRHTISILSDQPPSPPGCTQIEFQILGVAGGFGAATAQQF